MAVIQPFHAGVSIVGFLTLANLDMSGPWFDTTQQVGWANALKAIGLPLWLLARGWLAARSRQDLSLQSLSARVLGSRAMWLWAGLVVYSMLAMAWSPDRLAALKLVAALISHTLVFAAAFCFWLAGRLNSRVVLAAVLAMIALAALQSLVLGGSYEAHASYHTRRFTSFSSPQSFAAGLVAFSALLLWHPRWSPFSALPLAALVCLVLLANGSRIGFVGAVVGLVIWLLRRFDGRRLAVALVLLLMVGFAQTLEAIRPMLKETRLAEMVSAADRGVVGLEEVSTLGWRLDMYDCILQEIEARSPGRLVVGSGTSSGGQLEFVCTERPYLNLNPNRIIHCEFLRALYEWGLIGLLLLVALGIVFVAAAAKQWWLAAKPGGEQPPPMGPLASALPMVLFAMALENTIQAAASPATVAFSVVLAQATAASLVYRGPTSSGEPD
jgi:O-antigen ligase